jgi:hypothetical protein
LYVVAFDDDCYELLKKMSLPKMEVISLADFEDEQLLAIKSTRSKGEYCWTCTSSVIRYCILQFKLEHCIYLDADIIFFSDPTVLLNEIGNNSVLITPHWYHANVDSSEETGKFCVQFVYFKNDENGMAVLSWWRNACIEWCYNRIEDGKFGDQKYLDSWQTKFNGVAVLENRGGGVAPWNVLGYDYEEDPLLKIKYKNDSYELVFFHFHGLRIYTDNNGKRMVNLGNYKLSEVVKRLFYIPYIKCLEDKQNMLLKLNYKNKLINSLVFKKPLTIKEKIYNFINGINNVSEVNKLVK